MPVFLKSVKAELLDNFTTEVKLCTSISGKVQFEDYINLNGFIAYLQNFTEVSELTQLQKPQFFGLKNQYNQEEVTLQISY